MRRVLTPFCFVLTAIVLLSGATPISAVTRKKARELRDNEQKEDNTPHRTEYVERQGTALNLYLQAGKLVGEAASDIDHYGGDFINKVYYGFGGTLETPVTNNLYMGGSVELEWNKPHQDVGKVRLMTLAVRSRWLFTPLKRSTFYVVAGLGSASGSYHGDLNIDDDLGSHFSYYMSIGRQVRFGGHSINSFEFYYRTLFSKDAKIDALIFSTVPYNVTTIGVRLIFGFEF